MSAVGKVEWEPGWGRSAKEETVDMTESGIMGCS